MTSNEIDILLAALAAGAATGFKETATTAVKDTYEAFKALLQRRFARQPNAEMALAKYETDPHTYEESLKKVIIEEQLDQDQEIMAAAQRILSLTQQQTASEQFTITNQGTIQNVNQGIYNSPITQTFGEALRDK